MQAKAEAQISTNNSGRAAISTSRCSENDRMATERLQDVFRFTVRSTTTLTKPLEFQDVGTALVTTYGGLDGIPFTGININNQRKAVEISFKDAVTARSCVEHGLVIPNQPLLQFKLAYDDTLRITFYNVPLNSTGAAETRLVEDAGATVIESTTVTKHFNGVEVLTGERRFFCSGRSNFTYLPTVVRLYSGRLLGCRYRGQAHDLATKVQPPARASALAQSSNWGAADSTFYTQPIEPRSRSGTMETNATRSRSSTIASVDTQAVADVPPTGESAQLEDVVVTPPPPPDAEIPSSPDHKRPRSGTFTDVKDADEYEYECNHKCNECDAMVGTDYHIHVKQLHPTEYDVCYREWITLKRKDIVAYRKVKKHCSCPICKTVLILDINPALYE